MGVVAAVTVILASIYFSGYDLQTLEDKFEMVKIEDEVVAEEVAPPILIRVTGYGAYQKPEDRKSESKRLMVLRASKLDAYRNMAERVYGATISGASTVEDYSLKNDAVASMVDSVIRGARVISITEHKTKGVETILELMLPANFHDCLNKVNSFVNGRNCLRTIPAHAPKVVSSGSENRTDRSNRSYYLQ